MKLKILIACSIVFVLFSCTSTDHKKPYESSSSNNSGYQEKQIESTDNYLQKLELFYPDLKFEGDIYKRFESERIIEWKVEQYFNALGIFDNFTGSYRDNKLAASNSSVKLNIRVERGKVWGFLLLTLDRIPPKLYIIESAHRSKYKQDEFLLHLIEDKDSGDGERSTAMLWIQNGMTYFSHTIRGKHDSVILIAK